MKNTLLEFFFPIDTETEKLTLSDAAWIYTVFGTAFLGIIVAIL